MSPKVKRALPWIFSVVIVGWLYASIDLAEFAEAFRAAKWVELSVWLVVFAIVTFIADSGTLWLLFRRLLQPMAMSDVLAVKGVSYFLNAINYGAASGGIAYFVHKKEQTPFLTTLSTLLWLAFVDVTALLLLMTAGAWLGGDLLPPDIADKLPTVLIVGWAIVVGALSYWHLGVDWLILGHFRDWRLFHAFREARAADYLAMLLARTGFTTIYVLMHFAMLPTFDIHVDLMSLLVYVPILTFVQVLPASISGLGAVQWAMKQLYAPYVAGGAEAAATVVAISTIVGPATTVLRLGIGYAFMTKVARDLVATEEAIAAARAAEEEADDEPQ
ncbi:MAG: lysylphosphatidylglycerol synthase domain-containing protein [Myxococcota bacterium]